MTSSKQDEVRMLRPVYAFLVLNKMSSTCLRWIFAGRSRAQGPMGRGTKRGRGQGEGGFYPRSRTREGRRSFASTRLMWSVRVLFLIFPISASKRLFMASRASSVSEYLLFIFSLSFPGKFALFTHIQTYGVHEPPGMMSCVIAGVCKQCA